LAQRPPKHAVALGGKPELILICYCPLFPLTSIPLLDPLIERLQNSRIDSGDHIHRRVQFFFGHSRFPCVRKAPFHSRIAEPHHRDGQTHEHFLALAETGHGVRVSVELTKVGLIQCRILSV
jgi:hypothetical protein